tara:strand:+ start:754 stop:1146 length:393 start_codon:yes stop_codon:yes gene_type:complete
MIIRRDQMKTFQAYMSKAFEDRMVLHIATHYPDAYAEHTQEGEDDAGARTLVNQAIVGAGRVGARKEGSIQQYLEIMLETSLDFERDEAMSWAHDILADETLAGTTRIILIHRRLPRRLSATSANAVEKE